MADGADSEEFVLLSGPRIGLKREFAFALKAHTELFASHGSRTRAGRLQSSSSCISSSTSNASVFENLTNKRVKSSVVSNDESINTNNNNVLREEEEKESQTDYVRTSIDEEEEEKESQTDYVRTSIDEEETKRDTIEAEELNSSCCLVSSVNEEEFKTDAIGDKSTEEEEEGNGAEIPIVIDDNSETKQQQSLVEKPMKFYTRTLLKQRKTETVEISVSATTSSSSVLSGDVFKNEVTTAEDEGKTLDVASPLRTPSSCCKLEMKMSKKIALTKLPSKVKELLETGLLEGLPVHYVFRNNKREGLKGTIKDIGIMCSCTSCKGSKVVLTPLQFERHAGSANKRAADYIYLENGNNLRSVMNACRDAPLDALEETIKNAISSSPVQRAPICQNCKGAVPALPFMRTVILCTSCLELKKSQASSASTDGTNARWLKPLLTPKSSNSGSKCVPAQRKSNQGKLTRKDLRLHKLVFEEDGLPDGTELAYYIRGQKLLEGYKKGFGIFCRCCDSEVSPSQFEAHAGWASRRKPYLNIYTSNGVSLHELSLSLSKGRKHSAHDNDDLCSICADFGDLLLCDACPRAFHQDCVGLLNLPCGDWYCPYCQLMYQREKSCEYNANAKAAGRVPGVDPIAEISQRCIRIVKTPDTEVGGCVLCRSHGFSKSGFGPRTVLLCDQCEKEFHVGCLKDHKMEVLRELPKGEWFCCTDCSNIHSVLQKLLVRGSQNLPDSLLNIIKKKHVEVGSNDDTDLDVRWTLLSGKSTSPESRLLLSKAVAIFNERFDPIVDSGTGRDLIPSMVYGRSIRDQDFGGMYCAVLTENSSVVSAGIVRIFGVEVAELPLVATNSEKQGRGYFQSLFSCIEQLLGSLNVKNLVLPAADEAESIWTNRFGFKKMTHEEVSTYRKDCQMMTFHGTPMLQKTVAEVASLEI